MVKLFVTGTGTDVGKTYVSAGLAWQICNERKNSFRYIKPVASGVINNNSDVEFVGKTIQQFPYARAEGWYSYQEPASPYIAAKSENTELPYLEIVKKAQALGSENMDILMEGAGGIFVPLTENKMVVNLVEELQWPVIIVGHYGLGTVNHTCLTIEALQKRKCVILGVILNQTQSVDEEYKVAINTNQDEIKRLTGVDILGVIRYGDKPDSSPFLNIWQKIAKRCK